MGRDDAAWLVAVEYMTDRDRTKVARGDIASTAWLGGMLMREYEAAVVYPDARRRVREQLGTVPSLLRGRRVPEWAAWSDPGIRDHDLDAYCVALAAGGGSTPVIGIDPGVGFTKHSGTGICAVVGGAPVFAATRRAVPHESPSKVVQRFYEQLVEVVEHILHNVAPEAPAWT